MTQKVGTSVENYGYHRLQPNVAYFDPSYHWGNYSKWIIILQGVELNFVTTKSKKSLSFADLMSKLPRVSEETMVND